MGNGQVYWQCRSCDEKYYKSKGSCPECGGCVVSRHKGKGDNFTGSFRQMTIPQIIGYVLGLSGLFMLTVIITAYFV